MAALCLYFPILAQTSYPLKGKLTDQQGQPLPGASITLVQTGTITQSDNQGLFTLNSPSPSGTIRISFLGHQTIERTLHYKQLQTITIQEDQNQLNEVQVIGYGSTTKRLATGAIASISNRDIERQPVTNILSSLSGRMPGVQVQSTNGLPGGNISITIRGKGSISAGTEPLYIIDGMPYETTSFNITTMNTNNIGGRPSPLNSIDPNDIQRIDILKDADATAIYGSRGANGVVLITTKKAASGKAQLSGQYRHSLSSLAQRPRLQSLSSYLAMRWEAFASDNKTPSADPSSPNYAPDLTLWSQEQATDWTDYFLGNTASASELNAKLQGGGPQFNFSISGNYRRENTVLPGHNHFQRYGIRAQFGYTSSDNKLQASFTYQHSQQDNQLSNMVKTIGNILLPPNYPLYLSDGSYNWYRANPAADQQASSSTQTNMQLANMRLSYQLLKQLNLQFNAGLNRNDNNQILLFPSGALAPGAINSSQWGNSQSQGINLEPQADYAHTFGKLELKATLGATLQEQRNQSRYLQASNFRSEALMEDLASAGTLDARSNLSSRYRFASLFTRANLSYQNTYLLNLTLRRDGSSRFAQDSRFGNFGAIGAAILLDQYPFIKKLKTISHAKLRASHGSSGNDQIGDYMYLSTYASPPVNLYQDIAVLKPNRVHNSTFRWETSYKTDIALELGLWNNQLFLSANYYLNRSRDQLVNYALPQSTGFATYQANLPAVVQNRGWEFQLNGTLLQRKHLQWSLDLNLTLPKNQLKAFQNLESSSYANSYRIGEDINRISGYIAHDIDQATGKVRYTDRNGQPGGSAYSYATLGKSTPDYYGGAGTTLNYRNFSLHLFAQFSKQQDVGALTNSPGSVAYNNFQLVEQRWSPKSTSATIPMASTSFDLFLARSSLNVFDTSYIRLKTLSLSYRLPKDLLDRYGIRQLELSAEAQNLHTFWDRNAAIFDPEASTLYANASRNFPNLRSISFGLKFGL